jgi:hypothetical protein
MTKFDFLHKLWKDAKENPLQTLIFLAIAINLGGSVDIRRSVQILNHLPQLEDTLKQHGEDIQEIKLLLKKHNIAQNAD